MSLPHALLTSLLEKPSSGAELARRFDRSIGYFWPATHQQIYRELARLEKAGWIESLPAEPGQGRTRHYRALPAGREELARWTAQSEEGKPQREALMLRLRADAVIGPTGLEAELSRRLAQHQQRFAVYQAHAAHDGPPDPSDRQARLQALVLDAGLRLEQAWVDWCQTALQTLRLDQEGGSGKAQ